MTDLAHPDRLAKLEALRAAGIDPFPPRGVDARPIASVAAEAGEPDAPGPLFGETVTVAGRLLGLRDFGKLIFAPLVDRTGRMQIGLQKNRLSDWWPHRKLLDGGDLVGVTGEVGRTQKGELTIWARAHAPLDRVIEFESQLGREFEHHTLGDLPLDRTVVAVEPRHDPAPFGGLAEDADVDRGGAQVRRSIDAVDSDQGIELVVAGDQLADFALEQFTDAEESLAHGWWRWEFVRPAPRRRRGWRGTLGRVDRGYSVCSIFSSS